MLHVTVDGTELLVPEGSTIREALRLRGSEVPHLCHDERVRPAAVCRTCMVSVNGSPKLVPSCSTALTEGMHIRTDTPEAEAERRGVLRMLAWSYPAEPVRREPERPFHRALLAYGLEGELGRAAAAPAPDDSSPYIHVDMSRCIECYRCVRICAEVQGQFTWHVYGRGDHTQVLPDSRGRLADSSCVACGACVDTCPTGALEDKSVRAAGLPTQWTRTTCAYCGVGCELQVGTRGNEVVDVRPALDAPVNRGHLCVKGRYAFGYLHAQDRVTRPLLRERGAWREASWDEALGHVAERLGRILSESGPRSVGMLGSSRATNEENYVTQKLARVVLGTNNVDCCARVCHAPSAVGMREMLGTGAATGCYDDIELAHTLLVFGANATENHPIVGARLKQAALRGARLVVVDPRRIELAQYATVHLRPRPGTNVLLLNALACCIVEEGLADARFLAERVSGREEFERFVRAYAPEQVAADCGVDAAELRRAARLYASGGPAMSLHGLGVTEQAQGTEAVMGLVNLALLTGNVGRPGAGVNPLRGQNNVQGAAHMGCEPGYLTGFVPLEAGRARFEQVWGAPVPRERGLDLMQMMDAAEAGQLRALWTIGYDLLLTNPDAQRTTRALEALELVVVQDLFLNETARQVGTVFLPVAGALEKDGTFMNAERRVQRVRRAVHPPGETLTDWEVLCAAARALGHPEGFTFSSAEQIWDEVRSLWPAGAGLSYARLEQGGLQWPCPSEDHPGTQRLHTTRFTAGERAALRCLPYRPSAEQVDEEFPLLLVTGRTLSQFNAGTMTGRTPNVQLRPTDLLDVCAQDAARYGLRDGEPVRVRSRHGEAVLPVHVSDAVRPGELFASFQTPELFVNRLTGPGRDPHTHTPEYKRTAVQLLKPA